MADPTDPDKRRERRNRVLKRATILVDLNTSEIACSIRNMHQHGAELQVSAEVSVPTEFLLYVPVDGQAYRSVVRWRHKDRVGVEFKGTEPKPHWHYG